MTDFSNAGASTAWIDTVEALDQKAFVQGFLSKRTRPDGRPFSRVRPTTTTTGVLPQHTYGSALVRVGDTQVLAGVTLQLGQPRAACGDVVVVSSSSSSSSSSSPAWLRFVLTDMVDTASLVVNNDKAAWRVRVSLRVLDNQGNVQDASLLAAVAALQDTVLPPTQPNDNGVLEIIHGVVVGRRLPLLSCPVSLTLGIHGNHLLADPTLQEEPALDGTITMVVTTEREIMHVQHASRVPMGRHELALCAEMAFQRATYVMDHNILEKQPNQKTR